MVPLHQESVDPAPVQPTKIILTLNSESNVGEILGEDNLRIEGLPSPLSSYREQPPIDTKNDTSAHAQIPVPILPSLPMHSSSADEGVEDD